MSAAGAAHVPGTGHAAVLAVAAESGLHGHYPGQEAGPAHRSAKGAGDGGAK